MSRYSGKCDFGDTWEILGDRVNNLTVYFGKNIVPLKIESYKDALPYFPFLVASMASSDEGTVVYLDTRSYVDEEEEDVLNFYWDYIVKKYKKYKLKKVHDLERQLLNDCNALSSTFNGIIQEMIKEVIQSGGKGKWSRQYHTPMAEYYRKNLYDDMIKAGWDEFKTCYWVYGWKRAFDMCGNRKMEQVK